MKTLAVVGALIALLIVVMSLAFADAAEAKPKKRPARVPIVIVNESGVNARLDIEITEVRRTRSGKFRSTRRARKDPMACTADIVVGSSFIWPNAVAGKTYETRATWTLDGTPAIVTNIQEAGVGSPPIPLPPPGTVTDPDPDPGTNKTAIVQIAREDVTPGYSGYPGTVNRLVFTARFGDRKKTVVNNLFDQPGETYTVNLEPGLYWLLIYDEYGSTGDENDPSQVLLQEGEQGLWTWRHLLSESATVWVRFENSADVNGADLGKIIFRPLTPYAKEKFLMNPGGWEDPLNNPPNGGFPLSLVHGTYRVEIYDKSGGLIASQEEVADHQNQERITLFW